MDGRGSRTKEQRVVIQFEECKTKWSFNSDPPCAQKVYICIYIKIIKAINVMEIGDNTRFVPEDATIVGNTCMYGATGGQVFVSGKAGERFAV
jgi:hypothetical protein